MLVPYPYDVEQQHTQTLDTQTTRLIYRPHAWNTEAHKNIVWGESLSFWDKPAAPSAPSSTSTAAATLRHVGTVTTVPTALVVTSPHCPRGGQGMLRVQPHACLVGAPGRTQLIWRGHVKRSRLRVRFRPNANWGLTSCMVGCPTKHRSYVKGGEKVSRCCTSDLHEVKGENEGRKHHLAPLYGQVPPVGVKHSNSKNCGQQDQRQTVGHQHWEVPWGALCYAKTFRVWMKVCCAPSCPAPPRSRETAVRRASRAWTRPRKGRSVGFERGLPPLQITVGPLGLGGGGGSLRPRTRGVAPAWTRPCSHATMIDFLKVDPSPSQIDPQSVQQWALRQKVVRRQKQALTVNPGTSPYFPRHKGLTSGSSYILNHSKCGQGNKGQKGSPCRDKGGLTRRAEKGKRVRLASRGGC